MMEFDLARPKIRAFLYTLHKVLLFKVHIFRYLPRLLSNWSSVVIVFFPLPPVQSKLVLPGFHWYDETGVEAASQKSRGTRQFIASVNAGSYENGLYSLLRLPFPRNRSTAYDLSERINYCFLLFIHLKKYPSEKERVPIQEMTEYILGNLEYYGRRWTNNHYLNNARALLSASILLRDRQLASRALNILKHALKINFPNDTFQERSSSYQCLVGCWLKSIYLYLSMIDDSKALRQEVLHLVSKIEIKDLHRLNFGDNTPDFSKVNIQYFSNFYDQFLPTKVLSSTSKWLSSQNSRHFDFSIVTGEQERFGPEHGYRNLACFQLTYKGYPIFLSSARPIYNKASTGFNNDPGFKSSGCVLIEGKSIYSRKSDLLISNHCTDPKSLPFASGINNDSKGNKFSLVVHSGQGIVKENFCFSDAEFLVELFHHDGNAITLFFLLPEDLRFINGHLDSANLKFSVTTSKNLVNLVSETCFYSDEYSVSKKGWRLTASFGSTTPDMLSFIKFTEKKNDLSI
jgi:hypothetical protein